jgi:predicted nucleic acid-binding protein
LLRFFGESGEICVYLQKTRAMKQRIYIDTSVVGGYFDKEFAEDTIPFFERVRRGEYTILLSDILEQELMFAPIHVKTLPQTIPSEYIEHIASTPEVILLATRYIDAKVVGKTSFDDCRHIAMATIYNAGALVSWNFKHIVNAVRIENYNKINHILGYPIIEIITPKTLINHEPN